MNYSFLYPQCYPPPMHLRGSIYSPLIGNEGLSQSISRHMEGQESSYSRLIEENSKSFCFYAHFSMYMGINLMHVQVGNSLKVAYTNKQVFFRDFLGSLKYKLSKGGFKESAEGHGRP